MQADNRYIKQSNFIQFDFLLLLFNRSGSGLYYNRLLCGKALYTNNYFCPQMVFLENAHMLCKKIGVRKQPVTEDMLPRRRTSGRSAPPGVDGGGDSSGPPSTSLDGDT